MDDSSAIRAITVGVSVFIAIITITAVINYYTASKMLVQQVGPGTDIAGLYNQSIITSLLKNGSTLSGTEAKNILNYFYNKEDYKIYLTNVKVVSNSNDKYKEGFNTPVIETLCHDNTELSKLNYNQILSGIMPNQIFELNKNGKKITLNGK